MLPLSKSKEFAYENFIVVQIVQLLFERVKNIMGKAENDGQHHFLIFAQCFLPCERQF